MKQKHGVILFKENIPLLNRKPIIKYNSSPIT